MDDYPESDANVTTASLRSAAAVMESLASEARVPSRAYGEYIGMANRLRAIADQRDEEAEEQWNLSDEPERVIPIPPEAISEDGWCMLAETVMGYAESERYDSGD